jgi:hypothetical protein
MKYEGYEADGAADDLSAFEFFPERMIYFTGSTEIWRPAHLSSGEKRAK